MSRKIATGRRPRIVAVAFRPVVLAQVERAAAAEALTLAAFVRRAVVLDLQRRSDAARKVAR